MAASTFSFKTPAFANSGAKNRAGGRSSYTEPSAECVLVYRDRRLSHLNGENGRGRGVDRLVYVHVDMNAALAGWSV